MLSASSNKVLRWELFACWQDELELLQSLATSDGSWPDELLACPPSPPLDRQARIYIDRESVCDAHTRADIYTYEHICIFAYMHTYIYIHRRIYECTHTHTHTHLGSASDDIVVQYNPGGFSVLGLVGALGDTFQ